MHPFSAPNHADRHVGVGLGKYFIIHIKPIMVNCRRFGCVQENAQIANLGLMGGFSPQHHCGSKIHRFGTGLLIVTLGKVAMSGGPGMPGIGIKGS